ncbi:flagellar basal body rod protein FlgB [Cellvibrio polysaccharolyticus]|uniref:Flagellar basal body rod protein FlgB n=1 Tax=Cellvibrio polysaccharolyticus TaxID=2082724 RepID=A0A928V2K6_9GAMM|nr:flagellar basal body rod protein FlgB [Cellvibrio polysaccharolyticus]MBE8717623.1 flagellar basal body rod protein FlgB [Cellvibrio polysaccharolyticus]
MTISFANALGIHESAMHVRGQRASILADNLANVDTPNYKAKDLDFKQVLSRATGSTKETFAVQVTNDRHLNAQGFDANPDMLYRVPHQPSIDGNTVEDQIEHAEYMKNALQFQASFTFLNSKFKGLTSALRGE